jgi:hypothetical protein
MRLPVTNTRRARAALHLPECERSLHPPFVLAQSDPTNAEAEGPIAAGLRSVQGFDFESGLAIFNGVHAALGFLPVIPGPCGLFRANAVTASMLEDVRLICTNPSTRDGIIQGNLKIAEDRILSYLLLLVPGPNGEQFETHWVPSTTFFFESEDDLNELVPQRRRWLNGTVAGYLWLLTNTKLWRGMFSCGLENDKGVVYYAPRLMPWKVRAARGGWWWWVQAGLCGWGLSARG